MRLSGAAAESHALVLEYTVLVSRPRYLSLPALIHHRPPAASNDTGTTTSTRGQSGARRRAIEDDQQPMASLLAEADDWTDQPPGVDEHDEDVLMAVRALGTMRNRCYGSPSSFYLVRLYPYWSVAAPTCSLVVLRLSHAVLATCRYSTTFRLYLYSTTYDNAD